MSFLEGGLSDEDMAVIAISAFILFYGLFTRFTNRKDK